MFKNPTQDQDVNFLFTLGDKKWETKERHTQKKQNKTKLQYTAFQAVLKEKYSAQYLHKKKRK